MTTTAITNAERVAAVPARRERYLELAIHIRAAKVTDRGARNSRQRNSVPIHAANHMPHTRTRNRKISQLGIRLMGSASVGRLIIGSHRLPLTSCTASTEMNASAAYPVAALIRLLCLSRPMKPFALRSKASSYTIQSASHHDTLPDTRKTAFGAPRRIRTFDLPLRRGPRYPAAPSGRKHRTMRSNIVSPGPCRCQLNTIGSFAKTPDGGHVNNIPW